MQGSLSIELMCQLARVSRAGFYRLLQERVPVEESMEVRSAIQRIALEHRRRCPQLRGELHPHRRSHHRGAAAPLTLSPAPRSDGHFTLFHFVTWASPGVIIASQRARLIAVTLSPHRRGEGP
jgi:hypothetical protein